MHSTNANNSHLVIDVLDPVVDVVTRFFQVLLHECRSDQLKDFGIVVQQIQFLYRMHIQ